MPEPNSGSSSLRLEEPEFGEGHALTSPAKPIVYYTTFAAASSAQPCPKYHSPSRGGDRRSAEGEGPASTQPHWIRKPEGLGRPARAQPGSEHCRQRGPKARATGRGVCPPKAGTESGRATQLRPRLSEGPVPSDGPKTAPKIVRFWYREKSKIFRGF